MSDNDLVYLQAPVMTQAHCDAMAWVKAEWPYANVRFDRSLLNEIHQHLTALLAQPVPTREHELTPLERITHASNFEAHSPSDWRTEFAPPTAEDCYGENCDQ